MSFYKIQRYQTDDRENPGCRQNQDIPFIFRKSCLLPALQICPSHKDSHRNDQKDAETLAFFQIIPHPCHKEKKNRYQYKGISLSWLCKIIKDRSSNGKEHSRKNQRSSTVQDCLCPSGHLRFSQDQEELNIQKNSQPGAEQNRILIIVHHILLRSFCHAESILQITGKQMLHQRIIKLPAIGCEALLQPVHKSHPAAVQSGGHVQKHLCHRKKNRHAHSYAKKHFTAACKKTPDPLGRCKPVQHQDTEQKVKSCCRKAHIGKIHAVDSAQKNHHREKSPSLFLLYMSFTKKQKQGKIDHRRTKLIVLSPHQKKTTESIHIGSHQLCLAAERKLG